MSLAQTKGQEPEEKGKKRGREENVEKDGGTQEHTAKEMRGVGKGRDKRKRAMS